MRVNAIGDHTGALEGGVLAVGNILKPVWMKRVPAPAFPLSVPLLT